jgi:hypothetical protein
MARVVALLMVAAGVGVAVVPFTTDAVVRQDPRVETTSDCPSPVVEAFDREADTAFFVDDDATPELSDGFGCGKPSRQRVAIGAGGVFAGAAISLFAWRRKRRRGPAEAPPPPEPVIVPAFPEPPVAAAPAWSPPPPNVAPVPLPAGSLEELEPIRTRQVLRRHLPPAPAKVVEVGAVVHAGWLTESGYRVDPVAVGEAGYLDRPNGGADAVLLLGPLTTLPDRPDRLALLAEARRIVRPGGLVAVGATNRFAALFAGLAGGDLFDPDQRDAIGSTLADGVLGGQHLHHPDELRDELTEARLDVEDLVGLEGLAGWLPQLGAPWAALDGRRVIVEAVQGIESEASLLGLSAHLLAIARRR